jgi:Lysozyme like domain
VANYTYAQLEGLWIQAGGNPATAPVAAAVAEAESGGNPASTSSNPDGGTNIGLWQLDTPGGKGGGYTAAQLQDPTVNAAVAVKGSSNGLDWSSWATYASGAYTAFLNTATTPSAAGLPAATTTAATTTGASYSADCLFGFPGVSLPLVGNVGSFCMFSRSEARGLIGGLCLGAAGIIGLAAVVILAASAFEHSGAASAVAQSISPVRAVVGGARKVAPGR